MVLSLSVFDSANTLLASTTINNPATTTRTRPVLLTATGWYNVIATGVFTTGGVSYTGVDGTVDELLIYT